MNKNIFLIAIALISFTFSANAQSCCQSKKGDKTASCSKAKTTDASVNKAASTASLVIEEVSETVKTEVFTVYGNCGMCEKTIEGALQDVKGITTADWDKETDQMTVAYDTELITLDAIKQKIADVGYDSDDFRATEETYNNLPGCCQYDRPAGK